MDSQTFLIPLYSVLLVLVGFIAIGLLCDFLSSFVIGGLLGPVVALGWSTAFLPGVIMHELSHAVFLALFGAKIDDIVVREDSRHPLTLYRRAGFDEGHVSATNTAGHVSYERRGPYLLQSLQRVVGAIAPTVVGVLCMFLLYRCIVGYCAVWWQYAVCIYLFICALGGSAMSTADIADMMPGLPVCLALLYLIFLATGFDVFSFIPAEYLTTFNTTLMHLVR